MKEFMALARNVLDDATSMNLERMCVSAKGLVALAEDSMAATFTFGAEANLLFYDLLVELQRQLLELRCEATPRPDTGATQRISPRSPAHCPKVANGILKMHHRVSVDCQSLMHKCSSQWLWRPMRWQRAQGRSARSTFSTH